LQKRSLTLAGHRTSVALEADFWAALEAMAVARGVPLTALIREIDEHREGGNLSSVLRVAVLNWYRNRA
jgi:predicted DNA-binding ribbon-helix-helix protein